MFNTEAGYDEVLFFELEVDDFDGLFEHHEVGWKLRFKKSYTAWKSKYEPSTMPPLLSSSPSSREANTSTTSVDSVNAASASGRRASRGSLGSGNGNNKFNIFTSVA